jgi:hypothetical protein
MSQINANYIIDSTILLALLTFAVRIMYVRLHRVTYLRSHKYKPEMPEYGNVQKMTSGPVIALSLVLLLLLAIRVGF